MSGKPSAVAALLHATVVRMYRASRLYREQWPEVLSSNGLRADGTVGDAVVGDKVVGNPVVGERVGTTVGVKVGMSELNSVRLVGARVGN